jgi:hypothetical protein
VYEEGLVAVVKQSQGYALILLVSRNSLGNGRETNAFSEIV